MSEQAKRINEIAKAISEAVPNGIPAEDVILAMAIVLSSSFGNVLQNATDKQDAVQWIGIQKLQFDMTVANSLARNMPMANYQTIGGEFQVN